MKRRIVLRWAACSSLLILLIHRLGTILQVDLLGANEYYTALRDYASTSSYFHGGGDHLTTFLWHNGIALHDDQGQRGGNSPEQPTGRAILTKVNYTIDAATIGSRNASALTRAQMETWGKHTRYFFGATESDDADRTCNSDITSVDMVVNVTRICRTNREVGPELRVLPVAWYANEAWIMQKANPIGWLCGHQRFPSLLGKVGKFYQHELATAVSKASVLPDFLLIQDDDSYYNLNMLHRDVFTKIDSSIPYATAGCLIHFPIKMANFSFPYGGFGTILSRGAILRMIRPIFCHTTSYSAGWWEYSDDPAFVDNACEQLQKNTFGEKSAFRDGMSISDLMRAHAAANPFREYEKWTNKPGYCFHGDWLLGYYINYYNLGSPPLSEGPDRDLPHFNLEKALGYGYGHKPMTKNCLNDALEICPPTAHVCHRQTPESMARLVLQHAINATGLD